MIRTLLGLLVVTFAACECEGGLPPLPPIFGGEDAGAVLPGCAVDDDCALGERCVDGSCTAVTAAIVDEGCQGDDDCAAGELCATATGRCVTDAPAPGVPTGPPGACNEGEQRTCGEKIGACDYGVELCAGGAWSGVCTGAIGPVDERCDDVDDDCDGLVDEDFPAVGDPCADGLGACQVFGFTVCSPDGAATVCTARGLDPTGRVERCGGDADDDCDGEEDEGFTSVGDPCFIGDPTDPCRTEGVWGCAAGGLALNCEVLLSDELCNGVDDDNDACIDEGFGVGDPCQDGVGACVSDGELACAPDLLDVVCVAPQIPPAVFETCDGDDDDCNAVDDNGCDDDGDDYCDAALAFTGSPACPLSTAATLDCNDESSAIRPGLAEVCNNLVDEDCDGALNNGCAACVRGTDGDFDGFDRCDECDDTNGGVFPTAVERCNGVDEDCDGLFDETFDKDSDTYTTCGTGIAGGLNPARIDCNDTLGSGATINPGACELCLNGAAVVCGGTQPTTAGNNVDEDCDGYIDELCQPCSITDPDNDGFTECEGDCAVSDPAVNPGRPEACDGKDTDCNIRTVENCDVGDPCNFAVATDECMERLLCVESLSGGGNPTGNFSCTSFCNTSPGGVLGDSCDADETCGASLTPSENLHGCAVTTGFGAAVAGTTCSSDDTCRSGRCVKDFRLTGNVKYCLDFCAADSYCAAGTTCQASAGSVNSQCLRLLSAQDLAVGATCTASTAPRCENGSASCVDRGGGNLRCSEPCCSNSGCASTERCGFVGPEVAGPNGGVDSIPYCVPKSGAAATRPAGAACTTSSQCAGEFCDVLLGVCVDVCCNDATCPTGQLCDMALVTLPSGSQTFSRMCLSSTPADPLEAR